MSKIKENPYIILYVLKDLGKGITTKASELFELGDIVDKTQLLEFAREEGMTYETGKHLIVIRNVREVIYIKAVEYLKGDEDEKKL